MAHHTKDKGDFGVLKAQVDLYEKGYMILLPQTEHAPFDLVAYKDGVFKRIQVKYRGIDSNGVIKVKFGSTHCNTKGVVYKRIDKSLIDLYCIYCPDTDTCYYVNPWEYQHGIVLRISSSKNKQISGVNFADNFREIPLVAGSNPATCEECS